MIITHTKYTDEDLKKIKGFYKEARKATWIGEEGGMVCVAASEKDALIKFKRLAKEEGDDFNGTIEDIGIAYMHLLDDNRPNETLGDCEDWYADRKNTTDFPVFMFLV